MKKGLTILLVLTLLLSYVIPSFAFSDTEGKNCEEAVTALTSLGIVEGIGDNTFQPDASLTRAELAAILVRIMGIENITAGDDIFTDVDSYHWAHDVISVAYRLGLIKGMDEVTFAPDAAVTYAQAVKMIVCALGYEVRAINFGGYPSGYLAQGAQLGILKGVSLDSTEEVSRRDTAIMIYQALDMPLLEKTAYGAGAHTYTALGDVTLLSKYKNIFTVKGQVTANYFTTIQAVERSVLNNEVAIGNTIYNKGETNADNLLGREVKAFYNYPDGQSTPNLIAVIPASNSEVLTVAAEEINPATTKTKLVYDTKGAIKSLTASIHPNAVLVYNGKVKTGWTERNLFIDKGFVTAISNDGVSYDLIFVESYVNYVVNTKNADKSQVYFKADVDGVDSMIIDPSDRTVKLKFTDNEGEEIDIYDLEEWDILSVSKSEDGKSLKIIKCSDVVTGKVTETSGDKVTVNGEEYRVVTNDKLKAPLLEMSADFQLDFMGSIAAVNPAVNSSYKYGYLVSVSYTEGLDKSASFKVFTEDGVMTVLEAADKMKINGMGCTKANVLDRLPLRILYNNASVYSYSSMPRQIYSASGETVRQLIKYKTNDDADKITEILTAENKTENADAMVGGEGFNMIWELDGNKRALTPYNNAKAVMDGNEYLFIGGTVGAFGARFLMRGSTKIFVIPNEDADDKKYSIKAVSTLSHGNDGESYSKFTLYDLDDTYVVGAMVWDQSAKASDSAMYPESYSDKIGVVTGVGKGLNALEEDATTINVYNWSGSNETLYAEKDFRCGYKMVNTDMTKDPYAEALKKGINGQPVSSRENSSAELIVSDLKIGDIIQYTHNSDNIVNAVSVLFRADTPGMYENGVLSQRWFVTQKYINYTGGNLISNGTVMKVGSLGIVVENHLSDYLGNKGAAVTRVMPVAGKMIAVDMKKKTYQTITYDDLIPSDVYVAVWESNTQKMFIVYRY